MSSRQQFLNEGPGDTDRGDCDSDNIDSQQEIQAPDTKRFLNINQTQQPLDRTLINKKQKNINTQNDNHDIMDGGLVVKKKKVLTHQTTQNKLTGEESPKSDAQLVKRMLSIKTDDQNKMQANQQQINSHQIMNSRHNNQNQNKGILNQYDKDGLKKDLTQQDGSSKTINEYIDDKFFLPQKSKTLKLQFYEEKLQKHVVETNIDPNIIKNYEEEKELDRQSGSKVQSLEPKTQFMRSKTVSQKQVQLSGDALKQSILSRASNNNGNTDNDEKSNKNAISDKASLRVLHLLKTRKSEIFQMAAEEEDILDQELNLDEEPMTQGSIDKAVEIYGTKDEFFIIHHAGVFRIRWDLWIILFVLYNCIQVPLEIAFEEQLHIASFEAFGYFVDANFFIDILFNFRTTYIDDRTGFEVVKGKQIAINYIKQWRFYLDLLSIIPFELIYTASNPDGSTNTTQFKIFDLLKLMRLLRLGRIITYLKVKQDIKIGFRIVSLLSMLLLLVHWVGCIWFLIIKDAYWVPPVDANYGTTNFYDESMGVQYPLIYYYSILLLLGGDIFPTTTGQTVYSAFIVIVGSIMSAFIFGNMAALMAAMNQRDSQFQDQFDAITNLMRAIKLPVKTQREVEAYLIHVQQVPDMQDDMKTFLNMLSPSLRSTILFHIYRSIIRKIPIFDSCSNIELRFIVNYMKTVIFLPDDEITRQGDKGSKLYFISRGKVEVYIGPDESDINEYELRRLNSNGSKKSGSLKSQIQSAIISIAKLGGDKEKKDNLSVSKEKLNNDSKADIENNNNNIVNGPLSSNNNNNHKDINIINLSTSQKNDNNNNNSNIQDQSFKVGKKTTFASGSAIKSLPDNDNQSNMLQIPSSGKKNSKDGGSVKGGGGSVKSGKSGKKSHRSTKSPRSKRSDQDLPQINQQKLVRVMSEGEYFGEVALITNLKRTATVKAKDFTTLGYMMQKNFIASKDEFPQIYQAFKNNIILRYQDENFQFRQKMIRNVPYFNKMSDTVIQELVYLLRPTRYDSNMLVVKRGDSTDRIYFLKAGIIDVEVPLKDDNMHFDSLNAGSCFCIFSAFHDDRKQKFDFRTNTACIVESISAKDILALQKQYLELSDELKTLMVQIENNEKSEFDFFRYVPSRFETKQGRSEQWKKNVRRKFRLALAKFFRRMKKAKPVMDMLRLKKHMSDQEYRESLIKHMFANNNVSSDDENEEKNHFKALRALDKLEKERKNKEQKLKMLKDRISNPSLFVISSLLKKKSEQNLEQEDEINEDELEENGEPRVIIEPDDEDPDVENTNRHMLPTDRNKDFDQTDDYIQIPLLSEQSVELGLQQYPKIDGIRKDLRKFRDEQFQNNFDVINAASVANHHSQMHQPGAVVNTAQDFTTVVQGYKERDQNTTKKNDLLSQVSNQCLSSNNKYQNDLQIDILEDAQNNNKNKQAKIKETDLKYPQKVQQMPAWKQKMFLFKDEEQQIKKKTPLSKTGNANNLQQQKNTKNIKFDLQQQEYIISPKRQNTYNSISKSYETLNSKNNNTNKNNFNASNKNIYIDSSSQNLDINKVQFTSSNVRFQNQNLINSIASDNVSQMLDKADNKQLQSIKEENNQGSEDLIKVLTQINSSLQEQQKSMNTLQSDMLNRMLNLEKKLNRAMLIDMAASNKNKSELPSPAVGTGRSQQQKGVQFKKHLTHAEEIKVQLDTEGSNSNDKKVKFHLLSKTQLIVTDPLNSQQQNQQPLENNSKQTSFVTSIDKSSKNNTNKKEGEESQLSIHKLTFYPMKDDSKQQIDQLQSQIYESGVVMKQHSSTINHIRKPSGVSKGLEISDSINRKKGDDMNILSPQQENIINCLINQQDHSTSNFLRKPTKQLRQNNLQSGNKFSVQNIGSSQYHSNFDQLSQSNKHENTPYFMTEYNDTQNDQSIRYQLANSNMGNIISPPKRERSSQGDSRNTEVKNQEFNGITTESLQKLNDYQRQKNSNHINKALPINQKRTIVDNSMKKMMVEGSQDDEEAIDINNARGYNNNNQFIDQNDQTLILDDQFFNTNLGHNSNQNYLETEKFPNYITPEYLLNKTGQSDNNNRSLNRQQQQQRAQLQNSYYPQPNITYMSNQQIPTISSQQQLTSSQHRQSNSQTSYQRQNSGQQTPQVIYELKIDNLKLQQNQQVKELNIIWLPNSIVQFQGGANNIVETAKKQQQEMIANSSNRDSTKQNYRSQSHRANNQNNKSAFKNQHI